jgi:hypothetical protein
MKCFLKSIVTLVAIFCMMGMAYQAEACCSGGTPPPAGGGNLHVKTSYNGYWMPGLWTCGSPIPSTENSNITYQITVSASDGQSFYTKTYRKQKYDTNDGFVLEKPNISGQMNIGMTIEWRCQRLCGSSSFCQAGNNFDYLYAARTIWRGNGSYFFTASTGGDFPAYAHTDTVDAFCCF